MLEFKGILGAFSAAFRSIYLNLRSSKSLLVTNDDEIIDRLLKKEEDKINFQKEVDELIRSNQSSRKITINNKEITISV